MFCPAIALGLLLGPLVSQGLAIGVNPHTGRIRHLVQTLSIDDEQGDYLFASLTGLGVAADGSIIVREGSDKLLRFDREGRYRGNLVRRGKGPEEVREVTDFSVHGDTLIVFDGPDNKLLQIDLEGRVQRVVKLHGQQLSNLIVAGEEHLLLTSLGEIKRLENGLVSLSMPLHRVSWQREIERLAIALPTRQLLQRRKSAVGVIPLTHLISVRDGNRLYICHGDTYEIKVIEIETGRLLDTITRKYPRVPIDDEAEIDHEAIEYHADIQNLLIHEHQLWVLTANYRAGKGVYTEALTPEGRLVDAFFLPFDIQPGPGRIPRPMAIDGDRLYLVEWDEEWNLYVNGYRIVAP